MMRRLIFLLLMVCCLIPSQAQQQDGRGLIRQGVVNNLDSEISSFNPLYCEDDACEIVAELLFPTLLATDHETRWFTSGTTDNNALAESWSISDDGRIYTFRLREDALWSDGTAITAYDYFYSFLAIHEEDASSNLLFETSIQESIEAVVPLGDFELAVIFSDHNCDLLSYADLPLVPVHVFDATFAETAANFFRDGDDLLAMWEAWDETFVYDASLMRNHPFNDNPSVSAGDFEFVDWDESDHIRLQSGDLAYELRPVRSQIQMIDLFLEGELDVLPDVPRERIADFVSNPDVQVIESNRPERVYINLNLADPREPRSAFDEDSNPQEQEPHPILSNLDVRRALELAINREELIEIARHGQGIPISSFFIPTTWVYEDSVNNIEFNPDEAERLLENAGWVRVGDNTYRECVNCSIADEGTRLSLSLGYFNRNTISVSAIIIQQQLRRVGVDISLNTSTFNDSTDQRFDMYMTTFTNNYPSSYNLETYYTAEADIVNTGFNITSYINPEIGNLIEQAQTVPGCNLEARQQAYQEVDRVLQEDLPAIWLYANTRMTAIQADVQNVTIFPEDSYWNLSDWRVFDAP